MIPSIAPPSTAPTKRPRTATFSPYSELAFIPREPASTTWYTGQENDALRRGLVRDVRRIAAKIDAESTTPEMLLDCLGIEELVIDPNMARLVIERRQAHIQAVLCEQSLQAKRGVRDVERLAAISRNGSQGSCARARRLALVYRELDLSRR